MNVYAIIEFVLGYAEATDMSRGVMNYAGARQEVMELETAGGDRIRVNRTNFSVLFRDPSVHAAATEIRSAPTLTHEVGRVNNEDFHRYIRNVS